MQKYMGIFPLKTPEDSMLQILQERKMPARGKALEGPSQVEGRRGVRFRGEAASGARAHRFALSDPKVGEGGNLWHLSGSSSDLVASTEAVTRPLNCPDELVLWRTCSGSFLQSFSGMRFLNHQPPGFLLEMHIPGLPQIHLTRNSGSGAQQSPPLQAILVPPKV